MMEYSLVRSKRKTVALYIRDGIVEVRSPMNTPKHVIDSFVASKESWIADKLAITSRRAAQRDSFSLDYGSSVLYRGAQYPIEAKEGNQVGFDDKCFYMPPNLTPEQIKQACVMIFRMLAKRDLPKRTVELAQKMAAAPASVRITDARTRWGSCSEKKRICFSWRLIMADDDLIDYIIIHELAHLTELNHSGSFWKIVESVLPDYVERQTRLKELQQSLAAEDW